MLASRAQVHRTYVTSVESGARNLSLLNMLRLAYELGMDPGDLVEGIHLPCSVLRGEATIVLDDGSGQPAAPVELTAGSDTVVGGGVPSGRNGVIHDLRMPTARAI